MPLYPGYTRCGNCGFDSALYQPGWAAIPPSAGAWAGQVAPQPAPRSILPIVLAVCGVVLLAAAGALFALMPKNASGSGSSPSTIAAASGTPTATATVTLPTLPTEAPATEAPTTSDTSTSAPTVEPSPDFAWSAFTAPDKKWSVRFPGSSSPIKESIDLPMGATTSTLTMYAVADASGSAVYAVAFLDVAAGALPGDVNTYLALMDSTLASSMGGTLLSSGGAKMGTYTARDLSVLKGSQTYNVRIWFAGNRFYMLMTIVEGDAVVYTQHFIATFTFK
jgi:hypothetical protein